MSKNKLVALNGHQKIELMHHYNAGLKTSKLTRREIVKTKANEDRLDKITFQQLVENESQETLEGALSRAYSQHLVQKQALNTTSEENLKLNGTSHLWQQFGTWANKGNIRVATKPNGSKQRIELETLKILK